MFYRSRNLYTAHGNNGFSRECSMFYAFPLLPKVNLYVWPVPLPDNYQFSVFSKRNSFDGNYPHSCNDLFLRVYMYWYGTQSVNGITGCRIFRTGRCLQNVYVKNTTTKMPLSFYGQKSCYKQEVRPVGFRVATSNSVNRL